MLNFKFCKSKKFWVITLSVIIFLCSALVLAFANFGVTTQKSITRNTDTTNTASVWDGTTTEAPSLLNTSSSNSESNPYLIASAENLAFLSANADNSSYYGKYYKQTVDIDLNNNLWTPISATTTRCFRYDGDGHTISNLNVSTDSIRYCGLFGGLQYHSYIKNLGIESGSVKYTGTSTSAYCGGLVGYAYSTTLTNVYNQGSVTGYNYVGGLVGYAYSTTLTNVYNQGDVTGSSEVGGLVGSASLATLTSAYNQGSVTGSENVGGLVGRAYGSTTLTSVYNQGNITATSTSIFAGGFVGYNMSTLTITQGYNASTITTASTSTNIGGLVGYNSGTLTINHSHFDSTLFKGDLVGVSSSGKEPTITDSFELPTTSMQSSSDNVAPTGFNSDEWAGWWLFSANNYPKLKPIEYTKMNVQWNDYASSSFGGGTGTSSNPYIISSPEHLAYLSLHYADYSKCYFKQIANLNMEGKFFTPINPSSTAYTCFYEGGNHTISNLYISGGKYCGLFGYLSGGYVKNLGIESGIVCGDSYVGGLVGRASSTILTDVYNQGNVIGWEYIGGLVGEGSGTWTNVYNQGNVAGQEYIGGLVGRAYSTTLTNVYNQGNVTGWMHVGGLVGGASSTILTDVYNQGSVTGYAFVGGLVGGASGSTTLTNVYNKGSVTGSSSVGGLVGVTHDSATLTSAYNQGNVTGSSGVGGLVGCARSTTFINVYNQGNITGSSSVGGLVGSASLATLTSAYNQGSVTGSENVGGLVGSASLATLTSAYNQGSVTGSENVGGLVGYVDSSGSISISSAYNKGSVTGYNYVGGLVGCANNSGSNITLTNVYNQGSVTGTYSVGGLVGYNKNLIFTINQGYNASTITATSTNNATYIGGLVGYNKGTLKINYSYFDSTLFAGNLVGALADETVLTITGSSNLKTSAMKSVEDNVLPSGFMPNEWTTDWWLFTANNYPKLKFEESSEYSWNDYASSLFGGGTGISSNPYIISSPEHLARLSANYASLSGSYFKQTANLNMEGKLFIPINPSSTAYTCFYEGGNHTISNLYISGGNYCGLFGYLSGGYVKNLGIESGTISGSSYVGGLVGYVYNNSSGSISITNSYNQGSITGSYSYVGGLVGYAKNNSSGSISISNSYNQGSVTGYNYVGGLVGKASNNNSSDSISISNSYNQGSVTGSYSYVGGLVGDAYKISISNSYNQGSVTGVYYVGGLVGYASSTTLTNVYNQGNVTGYSDVGGLIGRAQYGSQTLTNVYNQENISSTSTSSSVSIGGLVGYNNNSTLTITQGYNASTITTASTSTNIGGLVGYNSGTLTINYSYFDNTLFAGDLVGASADGKTPTITGSSALETEKLKVTTNGSKPTGVNSSWSTTNWVFLKDYYPILKATPSLQVSKPTQFVLTYTGSTVGPEYDSTHITASGDYQKSAVGTYTATYTTKAGYVFEDGTTTYSHTWSIKASKNKVKKPTLTSGTFVFAEGITYQPSFSEENSDLFTISGVLLSSYVGTYTVTISLNDSTQYYWDDNTTKDYSLTWQITRQTLAKPTITGSPTYTGENITITDSTYCSNFDSTKMTATNTTQTNVGNYTLTISIDLSKYQWDDGTTNSLTLTWSITQATNSWEVTPSMENWIYGNTASTPVGTSKFGTVTRTYKASTASDSTYTSTIPTKAGTYTMCSYVAGTSNYSSLELLTEFTILKANTTPTISMSGYTYGGTKLNPTITSGNTEKGEVTYYYNTSNSTTGGTKWESVTSATYLNAGTYYMYAVVSETSNYNSATSETVEFTISKAKVAIPTVTANLTFNNQTQSPTITRDLNNTQIKEGSITEAVHAKTYIITIEIKDKTNYEFTDGTQSQSFEWTIKRFTITDKNTSITTGERG